MKRLLLITLSILFVLCGCASTESYKVKPDGTTISIYDRGTDVTYQNLPCKIQIDDKSITIESVDFYQDKAKHGYNLYAIMTVDTSKLTDDDIYWIDKDDVLDIRLNVDSEENNFESEYLSTISYLDSSNKRYISYLLMDESRYSFENADYDISVNATQKEKYMYNDSQLQKENSYYVFNIKVSNGLSIPSSKEIEPEMYEAMVTAINNLA